MRCRTEAVDAALLALVDRVTRRMRAKGRAGRTVVLRLRFGEYTRATRSRIGPEALTRATLLHRDAGRSHWLFPDEEVRPRVPIGRVIGRGHVVLAAGRRS